VTLRIATALTDAARESAVMRAVSAVSDVTVVRRCRDVVELRAVAQSAQVDVVVVDAGLRGLDRDVVGSLATAGVRCVVVGEHPLAGQSVTAVPDDLTGLADALRRDPEPLLPAPAGANGGTEGSAPLGGRVVVVWGPMGAPGRTTVAIELAASLAAARQDVLLVDCDTTGPSVAQLLGLLDDTSGVVAAARLAAGGRLTPEQLAGLAVSVPSGPRVLVGLAAPERWTELRAAALDEVLRCAREAVPWTLLDIGPCVEGDDLGWLDPDVPQRFGAARAALATADVVVCVGRADPVGLTRLLKDVPRIRSLAPTAEVAVVLNRTQTRGMARQGRELVASVLGLTSVTVPEEAPTVLPAQLEGVPVRERSPGSELARTLADLAAGLVGGFTSYDQAHDQAGRAHRRLLRGAHRRHRHRDAGMV
jgi:MinD-like ATPase involved in chromosome partitioning or flagellar assembly